MKKINKEKLKKQNAITLIALVITIIVLLILAGVSIATLTGENGILTQANNAKEKNTQEDDEEQIGLAYNSVKILKLTNSDSGYLKAKELENELLNNGIKGVEVVGEEILTVTMPNGKEYVISPDGEIEKATGIRDKEKIVEYSEDKIIFLNTIKEEELKEEYSEYETFEIIGISMEETQGFITTGYLQGKTGKLEIVGDIKELTFEYKIEEIMLGDEIFYLKVKIDDEERIQKLVVKQGEVVQYEESMLNFADSTVATEESDLGKWIDIDEDFWSGGHAKRIDSDAERGKNGVSAVISFEFMGKQFELLWGQVERASGNVAVKIYDEQNNRISTKTKVLDLEEKSKATYIFGSECESNTKYNVTIENPYMYSLDYFNRGLSSLVIDGIRIWK